MKVALVGMDSFFFATALIDALKITPGVELTACCDLGVSPEAIKANAGAYPTEIAERAGVPLFHSLEEMCREQGVEGACVATRPSRVVGILSALAEQKLHCYLVKPAVTHEEDLASFSKALDRYPGVVVSGLTGRLDPVLQEAKRRIADGDIGQPATIRVMHQHGKLSDWPKSSWYFEEHESPPTFTLGWYCVDLLSWLAGSSVSEMIGVADRLIDRESPHPDFIKSLCRTESGVLASIDIVFGVSWPYPSFEVEVIGERAAMRVSRPGYDGWMFTAQGPALFGSSAIDLLQLEIGQWARACQGPEAPFITKGEIAANLKACFALHNSIAWRR